VEVVTGLRRLGLTVAEIHELAGVYLGRPDEPIGPHLADLLRRVRTRLDARIAELQELRRRVEEFEATQAPALAGAGAADFRAADPRSRTAGA
jgi:DNA-binding transcriptional MerR regulator